MENKTVYKAVLNNRFKDLQYEINKLNENLAINNTINNISEDEVVKIARIDFAKMLLKEAHILLNEL